MHAGQQLKKKMGRKSTDVPTKGKHSTLFTPMQLWIWNVGSLKFERSTYLISVSYSRCCTTNTIYPLSSSCPHRSTILTKFCHIMWVTNANRTIIAEVPTSESFDTISPWSWPCISSIKLSRNATLLLSIPCRVKIFDSFFFNYTWNVQIPQMCSGSKSNHWKYLYYLVSKTRPLPSACSTVGVVHPVLQKGVVWFLRLQWIVDTLGGRAHVFCREVVPILEVG